MKKPEEDVDQVDNNGASSTDVSNCINDKSRQNRGQNANILTDSDDDINYCPQNEANNLI